jgi:serine/threonine protein kinase
MSIQTSQANASVEALVGRIADEFTQRLNRGERPSIEEYVQKHPEISDVLREVLPALGLLRRPDVEAALAETDPIMAEPLGDFRLIREIGRGAMGIVYEAEQLSLKRRVAVKILPCAAALDPRRLERFKVEAQAAASVRHEHIVEVYFIGCERGVHFFAMQYIEGLTLAAIIAELRRQTGRETADPQRTTPNLATNGAWTAGDTDTSPLTVLTTQGMRSPAYFYTVARLGLEAAKGLERAHQEVILHRDIKPANLLVDRSGSLWITDFGLALMRRDTPVTITGELLGTLRYMSPEQALAKRVPVDGRTDVYSLGATLYELLTLEPVFGGKDREELLRQVAFDDPPPPRRLNHHVPRDLETIVLTALAKAPAHRYASAQALAEDLRRFLNDEPIKARPEGLPRWLWRKSRKYGIRIALGLSAALTLVVLLLFLWHLNRPSPEEEENNRQQQALTALTQDLDLSKKVTLIGERGRPGYFRWVTDASPGKILSSQGGEFSVQNWEYGLVELLPDPRLQRYRFSAEVRHERREYDASRVGIYFAHSEYPHGESVAHFHCNVSFNDLVEENPNDDANGNQKGNRVGLQVHRQSPAGLEPQKAYVSKAEAPFKPARPPLGSVGPWRRIAVEVRPEAIKVFWGGNCIATTPRNTLMKSARWVIVRPNQPLPANSPQFAPRGGLGLYVSMGVASFRNVIVEPLGDEN